MRETLEKIRESALEQIQSVGASLEQIRIRYLGKKGELTAVLRGMGALSAEERPKIGELANQVRADIEEAIAAKQRQKEALALEKRLKEEKLDVTMPGTPVAAGHLHPLTQVQRQLEDIFIGMGFSIEEGPEVELDYYNFQALNIPKNHPARDTQDTFYITDSILLRSQTSAVQARAMERSKPPIRIISPGRVYRSDALDATHSPLFHQLEGLVVDRGITMGDLKGTLEIFAGKSIGQICGLDAAAVVIRLPCLHQIIDGQIVVGVGEGHVAGPEQVEDGPPERQAQHRQARAEEEQQGKGVAHDALGLPVLPPPPVDGAQGRAPHAAQVGKGHEDGDDGQAQAQPRQGQVAGQAAQIHPIHHVIQDVDELGHRHGQGHVDDIAGHPASGEVILSRICRNCSPSPLSAHTFSYCTPFFPALQGRSGVYRQGLTCRGSYGIISDNPF